MRTSLLIASATLLSVSLLGCSASGDETDKQGSSVVKPAPTETTAETPTASPAPELAQASYSDTLDEGNGYKQTVTVTIGPVILGADQVLMTQQWARVGGTGPIPCVDASPTGVGLTQPILESKVAGFAFGTVTITNDTPAFPAKPEQYQYSQKGAGSSGNALGLGYSNGAKCVSIYGSDSRFAPAWGSGATWGPLPIVVAIRDFLSPAFPKGDASKLAEPLNVNVQAFPAPPLAVALVPSPQ